MSFSTQPPEMLDMILNQTGIPWRQRFRLRAVSPLFLATLEDGLQRSTNALTIRVLGPQDNPLTQSRRNPGNSPFVGAKPDDLLIKLSDFKKKRFINFLGRVFSRVTQLTLVADSLVAWRTASELIGLFRTQLQTLTLEGSPGLKSKNREIVLDSLAETVNSIVTLKSLDFPCESLVTLCEFPRNSTIRYRLLPRLAPTLSRLERFSLAEPRYSFIDDNSTTLITTLSASLLPRCTHLRLAYDHFNLLGAPLLDQLASNLTHLHLIDCKASVLQSISKFRSLTSLTIYFTAYYRENVSTLLEQLRHFSGLTELNLLNFPDDGLLKLPACKARTFPSVKRLTVQYQYCYLSNYISSLATFLHNLTVWFPNMSSLSFYNCIHYGGEVIPEDLPFTVKRPADSFTEQSTFW